MGPVQIMIADWRVTRWDVDGEPGICVSREIGGRLANLALLLAPSIVAALRRGEERPGVAAVISRRERELVGTGTRT